MPRIPKRVFTQGQRFHSLVIAEAVDGLREFSTVRCDCGKIFKIQNIRLTTEETRSCGCQRGRPCTIFYSQGERVGRLTVIKKLPKSKFLCKCDCGAVKQVTGSSLKNGDVQSCGCLQRELSAKRWSTTGNLAKDNPRIRRIYYGMKRRCYRKTCKEYADYGQRGITICQEWRESSKNFIEWSLSNGYAEDLQIERKNNNGPYSPENCKWATPRENANNRRNTKLLTAFSRTMSMKQWSQDEVCVVHYRCLHSRLRSGWSIEAALTTPSKN